MVEVPLLDPASVDTEMTRSVLQDYDMQASASLVCVWRGYLNLMTECISLSHTW